MRSAAGVVMSLLLASAPLAARADDNTPQLNPFNDPFVQATDGIAAACPAPRGPAYSAAEIRQEAHYRAERGTSCWLAGKCSEPNAYRYDAPIARATVQRLREDRSLSATAIWVVVDRRFVTLQGCVTSQAQAARAEALAREVPDVELVVPMLGLPGETPRYPLAVPAPSPPASR
jgi:hypothetical protein